MARKRSDEYLAGVDYANDLLAWHPNASIADLKGEAQCGCYDMATEPHRERKADDIYEGVCDTLAASGRE